MSAVTQKIQTMKTATMIMIIAELKEVVMMTRIIGMIIVMETP